MKTKKTIFQFFGALIVLAAVLVAMGLFHLLGYWLTVLTLDHPWISDLAWVAKPEILSEGLGYRILVFSMINAVNLIFWTVGVVAVICTVRLFFSLSSKTGDYLRSKF